MERQLEACSVWNKRGRWSGRSSPAAVPVLEGIKTIDATSSGRDTSRGAEWHRCATELGGRNRRANGLAHRDAEGEGLGGDLVVFRGSGCILEEGRVTVVGDRRGVQVEGVVSGREMVVVLGVLEGEKGYKAGVMTRVESGRLWKLERIRATLPVELDQLIPFSQYEGPRHFCCPRWRGCCSS